MDNYKTQVSDLKNQLSEKDTEITTLKEKADKVDGLNQQIAQLTADKTQLTNDLNTKVSAIQKSHAIEGGIRDAKAKNVKAVKALLDVDALRKSQNRDADIKSAIESVKTDNGYMFEDGKQPPTVTVPGQPASTPSGDKAYIDAFYKNNPFYQKT